MKILMVCLGNICRSPMAEGVMRHIAHEHGLLWEIDSAGTGGWHTGDAPDPRAIQTAQKHGVDISEQQARKFSAADLDYFDAIYAMDTNNRRDILALATTDAQAKKVHLLLEKGRVEYAKFDVPDPYYVGNFDKVYELIAAACAGIVSDAGRGTLRFRLIHKQQSQCLSTLALLFIA